MWSKTERNIAISLIEENALYEEISKALAEEGFYKSKQAVRGFLRRKNKTYRNEKKKIKVEPKVIKDKFEKALADIEEKKKDLLELSKKTFHKVGFPTNTTKKILCISDLHIPFENPDTIHHALKEHSNADILVINGDFLETHAVSSWPKNKSILLKYEYQMGMKWLKLFSRLFKEVYLTSGNHEKRLKNYFRANVDPCVSFLVHDDMTERMVKGYDFNDNGEFIQMCKFDNVHYDSGLLCYYTKVGKCIFVHPSSFSKVPMATAKTKALEFLQIEDYQCLIVAHTHKIGKIMWRGKCVIEQGCCCGPMDYEHDGKMKYAPQAFGYAVVYMDDEGNVDFNKTNPVYVGTGFLTKEDIKL